MSAIAYLRVSSHTQESGHGLDVQENAVRGWCRVSGHELRDVYRDTISGASQPSDRPGLQAALASLSAGDMMVVYSRSRIARDVMIAGAVEHVVRGKKARLVSLDVGDQADTAENQLMRRMLDAFAEYERVVIKLRLMAGRRQAAAKGRFIGGMVPYGYARVERGRIVPVEPEYTHAQGIVLMHDAGYALAGIAADLNAREIPRRNGKPWASSSVRDILSRRELYDHNQLAKAHE